ncbi:MAG: efflux RND transporter permease subunit [Leptospiraceae bacterium]
MSRPTACLMIAVILVQVGCISLFRIPLGLIPSSENRAITIVTRYSGKDPETIERLITRPLEESLSDLRGLKRTTSESREGESRINAWFKRNVPIELRINETSEKIQPLVGNFPSDVNRPYIIEYSNNDKPVFAFSLQSDSRSLFSIRSFVESQLSPELNQIPGVADVSVVGSTPEEIQMILDPLPLFSSKVRPGTIASLVRQNMNQTVVGQIWEPTVRTVRIDSSIDSVAELRRLNLSGSSNSVSHWAQTRRGSRRPTSISRTDGHRRVSVFLSKKSSGSILRIAEEARSLLESKSLPEDLHRSIVLDRGILVRESLHSLLVACLFGSLIAAGTMFLFIRNLVLTLIASLSIPFSITASFSFFLWSGIELHAITFSALALSTGLLIDNAIVVTERIHSLFEEGTNSISNCAESLKESAGALFGGTFSTMVAFLPVLFLEGSHRQRYLDFALSISFPLILSLFFALVVLPGALRRQKRYRTRPEKRKTFLLEKQILVLTRNWRLVVAINLGLTLLLMILLWQTPIISTNSDSPDQIHARVSLPTGMHLQRTAEIFNSLEKKAKFHPMVRNVDARIEKNQGDLYLSLVQTAALHRVIEDLRMSLNQVPRAFVHFRSTDSGLDHKIRINFLGNDFARLREVVRSFAQEVRKPGTRRVIFHFRKPRKYLDFRPSLEVRSRESLAPARLAGLLKINMQGIVISKLHLDQKEMDLRLMGDWSPANGLSELENFPIPHGSDIRSLKELGRFKESMGEPAIWHKNKRRSLSLTVEMTEPEHETVVERLHSFFQSKVRDRNIGFSLGRKYRQARNQGYEFILSIFAALLLIYLFLGALFESFKIPLIILFSIPIPIVSALLAQVLVFGSLSQVALFSLMMLGGLTANGGILMASTIKNQSLLRESAAPECFRIIVRAAQMRLRPVLLTCITSIAGMLPLLFSSGWASNLWKPVALITITGTLVTIPTVLFLIPAAYYVLISRAAPSRKSAGNKNHPLEETQ